MVYIKTQGCTITWKDLLLETALEALQARTQATRNAPAMRANNLTLDCYSGVAKILR